MRDLIQGCTKKERAERLVKFIFCLCFEKDSQIKSIPICAISAHRLTLRYIYIFISIFLYIFIFIFCRLTVKELLESEFFQIEKVRVELARPINEILEEDLQVIPLRLKGERANHSQDEAIEFDYTIDEDNPELVAGEMVCTLF